jgi:aspartyl/asparaginyl beta-hydroxylase (cupin superfamily)
MEIEAVDPQTGRQLAALTPGWRAPVTELMVRFSKLAAAEIAIRKAATDFVLLLLQPASDAGKKTALR